MSEPKKKLFYGGDLIYGSAIQNENPYWHIINPVIAGGEFTVCGIAFDEVEINSNNSGIQTKVKKTGVCTCEKCIETMYSLKEMIDKCPALKSRTPAEIEVKS